MSKVEMQVEGMSCGLCVMSIEDALLEIGTKAKVDLTNALVNIEYDEKIVTRNNLKDAIEDLGYKVT